MERNKKEVIYVLDGSSYLYRAYFSTQREFTSSKGVPTRAIYVITNMILKILKEKAPKYLLVAWDAKGPTFRHKLYEEYKANRPPMPADLIEQVPYIKKIIDALGISQLEIDGFEADDIMAAVAKKVRSLKDKKLVLITGDKDMRQLVSENVELWDPMRDTVTDLKGFKKEFGIEPQQYVDVLALHGDPSDNVPGVPGIGPKTAIKLVAEYGSVENLIEHLEDLNKKKKLKENLIKSKEKLPLWKELVSLDDKIPVEIEIDKLRLRGPDKKRLLEIFKELDFESLIPLVTDGKSISYDKYELLTSKKLLESWLLRFKDEKEVSIDTETTSQHPMLATLVGISLCFKSPYAAYIPLLHSDKKLMPEEKREMIELLSKLISDKKIKKVGQNIKYDLIVLKRHKLDLKNIYGDTMIASYLLDPTKRRHNLDEIARDVLGHKMISFKDITKGLKRGEDFSKVPVKAAMEYACEDVHVTSLIKERFHTELKEKGLWDLYSTVEIPLVNVLAEMEIEGILVDKDRLIELKREFSKKLEQLEEQIYELSGVMFNINSTKQLAEILFEKLSLPQLKKTKKKTGYSTDVEVLKALAKIHPLPEILLSYRNLSKLKSTYIDGLEKEINPNTGRIHTSFNQTVTATGRLSSSDPNLQNIPIRTEEGRKIRALFIASKGNVLVSADYSQIDLRVLAHYSEDKNLLEAFKNDEDIHRRTAAQIFGVEPDFVTSDMRRVAKTVNFGIIYGMSAYGLAKELNIGRREAQKFIDAYFKRHPGVKKYMNKIITFAKEKGYVETILGRRRYIKEINARNRTSRKFAERTAINTPIQGSAADIIKLAMIKVWENFKDKSLRARLLLQVHDELVVECAYEIKEVVMEELKNIMENIISLKVPLKVSVGWGKNWSDIK